MENNTNFLMPAEWDKHEACWMAWPHDKISFPPPHLEKAEERYVEIIKALTEGEKVFLLVLDNKMRQRVKKMLEKQKVKLSEIIFYTTDYADVWLRDYGPMFVRTKDKKLAWIKWQYDAYTKKFPALLKDNEVFHNLRKKLRAPMQKVDMVLEGGAIEQNGKGTVIATEQCLLESGRNPTLSKEQIENNLRKYLGATNIIWLKRGIENDHTDGHIDDIVRFVAPDTIICAYEEDTKEKNHKILKQNFENLKKTRDENGKPFTLIRLQVPHMQYDQNKPFEAGNAAPASYTNFYIGNSVIIVPTYNDPNDESALKIIQSCFPEKKVVGIDCRDLLYGGGAIHCITQQQPTP
jgi:agmatine deiminase